MYIPIYINNTKNYFKLIMIILSTIFKSFYIAQYVLEKCVKINKCITILN